MKRNKIVAKLLIGVILASNLSLVNVNVLSVNAEEETTGSEEGNTYVTNYITYNTPDVNVEVDVICPHPDLATEATLSAVNSTLNEVATTAEQQKEVIDTILSAIGTGDTETVKSLIKDNYDELVKLYEIAEIDSVHLKQVMDAVGIGDETIVDMMSELKLEIITVRKLAEKLEEYTKHMYEVLGDKSPKGETLMEILFDEHEKFNKIYEILQVEDLVDGLQEDVRVLRAIRDYIKYSVPRVTAVYSYNNMLSGCYYRPKLSDLDYDLEAAVALKGGFSNVYTGYFDLPNAGVTDNITGGIKSDGEFGLECLRGKYDVIRALEILGYDYLYAREDYTINEKTGGLSFNPTPVQTMPATETILMDIYKALGIVYKDIVILPIKAKYSNPIRPAGNDLLSASYVGSLVTGVDYSYDKTYVFVTRSNVEKYVARAFNELDVDVFTSRDNPMRTDDFIIVLSNLMKAHGEPVLSEQEMYLLLQVYGETIPACLNGAAQDAYLYLKSRGVLNVDLDYSGYLTFEDMLNILMCVRDAGSRTDWKVLQPTYSIESELVKSGYYQKKATVYIDDTGELFTQMAEASDYYDYYILVEEDKTEFKRSIVVNGLESELVLSDIFVSNIWGSPDSGPDNTNARYCGRVSVGDSEYYHFIIKKSYKGTAGGSNGYVELNTPNSTADFPYTIRMPVGGGVYVYDYAVGADVYAKRISFTETGLFPGGIDKDIAPVKVSWLDRIRELFKPEYSAYAARQGEKMFLRLYDEDDGSSALTLTVANKAVSVNRDYLQNLQLSPSVTPTPEPVVTKYTVPESTTTLTTNVVTNVNDGKAYLVDVVDLISNGCLLSGYYTNNVVPEKDLDPSGDVLTLYLRSGYPVTLRNAKGSVTQSRIAVGNTVYVLRPSVNSSDIVWKSTIENDKNKVCVDVRTIFGHTYDSVIITKDAYNNIILTRNDAAGTSKSRLGSLSGADKDRVWLHTTFKYVKDAKDEDGNKLCQVLMNYEYPYANYCLVQTSNDRTKAYIVVFYPTQLFQDGIEAYDDIYSVDDTTQLSAVVGFKLVMKGIDWVYRVVELKDEKGEGRFSYVESIGWVYNVPRIFDEDKYRSGEHLLPLTYDKVLNGIIDHNSNIIINDVIYPAPVGVHMLLAGTQINYVKYGTLQPTDKNEASGHVFVIGNSRLLYKSNLNKLRYEYSPDKYYDITDEEVFYQISKRRDSLGAWTTYYATYFGELDQAQMSAVSFEDNVVSSVNNVTIETVNSEDTEYKGTEKFTLSYLIDKINESTSLIILFAFTIMPAIGLILVTVVLGLSILADNKIVQVIADKTIDLVSVLTLGHKNIHTITVGGAFRSCLVLYILFALALNGNLLKLMQLGFEWVGALVEWIKYN